MCEAVSLRQPRLHQHDGLGEGGAGQHRAVQRGEVVVHELVLHDGRVVVRRGGKHLLGEQSAAHVILVGDQLRELEGILGDGRVQADLELALHCLIRHSKFRN